MKCQGGNKYALSITVKFDQSTIRFGRTSFARFFKLTKHIILLFYLLPPYLLSCMRGSRNVRKNVHIIKTKMKICMHWNTVCDMTNLGTGGIQTRVSAALWPTDDLPQKSEAHCYTKRHAKINAIDIHYADYCCNSEDSDQPAHPLSRITSFFLILYTGRM